MLYSLAQVKKMLYICKRFVKMVVMSIGKTHFERTKRYLRDFYYEHGRIVLFALGLSGCVCLSYYFSRYIPEDLFAHVISPALHACIIAAATGGAILMHWHIDGIRARRVWQLALIAWTVIEAWMWLAEGFLGISTIVRGVQTIDRLDFIIRNSLAIVLLAYPFEVLCPKWLNWWRGILLVLPSILITLLDMVLHEDLRSLQIVYPLLIAWWLWDHIRVYRAKIEENYSTVENSAMPWVKVYLCILTIIGLSYFYLSFTYHPTRLFTQQWLVLVLLVYNTAQIVLRRKPWQEELTEEDNEDDDEERCNNRRYLEAWMSREKPYLNPDFKLSDLTQVMTMNRSYLSQFINSEYKCNFYQYVTNYRIEEAQMLMRKYPEMKMQDVAKQSGFASATVFSRVFAQKTGMTPTEWLQSIDNSSESLDNS